MAAIGLLHLISIPRRIKAPLCIIPFFRTPQQVTIPRGRHSSCSPLGASLMSWQGTRHFLISHGQEYPTHGQEYPTNIAPNHRPIPPWLCSSTPDDQGASPPPPSAPHNEQLGEPGGRQGNRPRESLANESEAQCVLSPHIQPPP